MSTVEHDIECEHFTEAASLAAVVQVQDEELSRLRSLADACPSPGTLTNVAGLMIEEGALIVGQMLIEVSEALEAVRNAEPT